MSYLQALYADQRISAWRALRHPVRGQRKAESDYPDQAELSAVDLRRAPREAIA